MSKQYFHDFAAVSLSLFGDINCIKHAIETIFISNVFVASLCIRLHHFTDKHAYQIDSVSLLTSSS